MPMVATLGSALNLDTSNYLCMCVCHTTQYYVSPSVTQCHIVFFDYFFPPCREADVEKGPYALIIAPTRELANQVGLRHCQACPKLWCLNAS